MNFDAFLKSVSKIENIELPGQTSQFKMAPKFRLELMERYQEAMKTSKEAGVLVLFYPNRKGKTHFVLILRKTYPGVHSGQVGFPGGKLEKHDRSLEHAAVRETFEEIGIPQQDIEVLRALTSLYIPPSNFTVHPFFGISKKIPEFIIDEAEVEETIEVNLQHLMDEGNVIATNISTSYKKNAEVPALRLNGHIVWGATAMVLSELKDMLKQLL